MISRITQQCLVKNRHLLRGFCSINLSKTENVKVAEESRFPKQADSSDPSDIDVPILYSTQLFRLIRLQQDPIKILSYIDACRVDKRIMHRNVFLLLQQVYTARLRDNSIQLSEVTQHLSFQQLCENLNDSCHKLDIAEMIKSLKIISHFGIPADSSLAWNLFEQIDKRLINTTDIKDIISMYCLLNELQPRNAVYTHMQITLLKRFRMTKDWQLNKLSTDSLTAFLSIVTKCQEVQFSDRRILSIIETLWRKRHMLTDGEAKDVLSSLLLLDTFWLEYRLLFELCVRRIECPSQLDSLDLTRLVDVFAEIHATSGNPVNIADEFLKKCGDLVIERGDGLVMTNSLYEHFKQIVNFEDSDLSEYIAKVKSEENVKNVANLGTLISNLKCKLLEAYRKYVKSDPKP